jgi:hypothetical protein
VTEHNAAAGTRAEDAPPRKAYEPPRLDAYGDIATLTRNVGPKQTADNGTPPFTRSAR